MLRSGLDELAPREREILRLRFYEGLTQREIADRIGVSQMHVSRLIRRSIEALREPPRRADGDRCRIGRHAGEPPRGGPRARRSRPQRRGAGAPTAG